MTFDLPKILAYTLHTERLAGVVATRAVLQRAWTGRVDLARDTD